jgi:hypothetical protein
MPPTIRYQITIPVEELAKRAVDVLKYWVKEDQRFFERERAIGPRPKDERSHLSDWSRLERDKAIAASHIWDAKIMMAALTKCVDVTITINSEELRWFYPELELEDSYLLQSE